MDLRLWFFAVLVLVAAAPAQATPVVVDFEGFPDFTAPGSAIPGITVSPEGGILDEQALALVTGIPFPSGTVATSPDSVLGNLFGATLTIHFDIPVREVFVETVGSLADMSFGTITMEGFAGTTSIGLTRSDPTAIGDSGAPEQRLGLVRLPGITHVVFSSDIGGATSLLLDDLTFTPVPEPSSGLLVLTGLLGLGITRHRASPSGEKRAGSGEGRGTSGARTAVPPLCVVKMLRARDGFC